MIIQMASSKYRNLFHKRLNSKLRTSVSSLKKENAFLKTIVTQFFRKHSEHIRLVEQFLTVETARLEIHQQLMDKNEKLALLSVQLGRNEGKHSDTDSSSDEWDGWTSSNNSQWLEYDQPREAYVRAVLDGMLWLENQQKDTNAALSQQHNQEHSDEKEKLCQMQEHYERLLKKAKDELEKLRKQVDEYHQKLSFTQKCCEERANEAEELRLQLQSQMSGLKKAEEACLLNEEDEQQLKEETKDLQRKLDEEKRRSASCDLQVNLIQRFLLDYHHADQKKIEDLERQITIYSQDLEDERQNCSYLKEQIARLLKKRLKTKDLSTEQSKRKQQGTGSCEEACPHSLTASSDSSLMDESFLVCPSCQTEYPASHYRELMNHLKVCLD
ncbi:centrosomal protein of 55 kDa-like isoform X2 [Nelusetta ayraudi]|uniref:centrosomal protein of 55 kDa-like isoform X2 n=1 Tax=Nelusetta ayraudi TaxID=303726 RepID=UPI003F6F65F9